MFSKTLPTIVLLSCILFTSNSYCQNDCPGLPSRAKFDTLGYISANIPTDPNNAAGKMYIGQGWVKRPQDLNTIRPGFIPSNKPSWAIAIAVAWNLARNTNMRVEYPNMNYWMATLIQETELRCATGLTWDNPAQVPDAYNPNTVYAAQINNGCLQIEGPGNAWSALQQAYPNGRIPTSSNPGSNSNSYSAIIEGVDGFEGSAIVKTYYDAYTSQVFNYNMGWDFYENIDCKQVHDPYAYIKMSASAYNGGHNAFLNAKTILDDTGPGCWSGLPATFAGYANDIARWVSVLENNTSYCEYPTGSSWGGWYDGQVPFSEVTKYLNIISPLYADVDFANDVIPYVEAAFKAKAGSLTGSINFMDFGDVIDAIVLHLPLDKPTAVEGTPIGVNLKCSGEFLPYGHVDILNGTTTMCLGQSVTLELMVDAGNDPNVQYKWFKGDAVSGTLIGTNKTMTITPVQLGTQNYAGQICNSNGCYTVYSNTQNSCQDERNINGWNVTANNCNLCPFVASGNSINAVCKGTPDGSISLNLTNEPSNYRVTYIATTPVGNDTIVRETSGSTIQFDGVRDGAYNFTLVDLNDTMCKAYTTVVVGYDTEINEYIKANILDVIDCKADLEADVLEQPTPCLWKVLVFSPATTWENWVNAVVTTSTGKTLIQKDTRLVPTGEWDPWNSYQISEFWLSLNTGDEITVGTAVARTPGASQLSAYDFYIIDESGNEVQKITAPSGGATFDANYVANPYTVTCPQNVPNYSIAWSPSINNETTTAIRSTGEVIVQSNDRVYTVTATNNANPQCILKDSVIVPGDLSCGTVCNNPGDVTLVNSSGAKLSDTIKACSDTTLFVKQENNTPGVFLFELFKDGVAQLPTNNTGEFTLSDAGKYWVLASDNVDAGNTDCHVYSDTIQLIRLTVPVAPNYKKGDTIVCRGSSNVLFEITSAQFATNYQWIYTGSGITFDTTPKDTIAVFDVALNAIDGDLIIVGTNDCGTDSLIIPIRVVNVPEVNLGNDTTICAAGGLLHLDAKNIGSEFLWSPNGETMQSIDVSTTGEYKVEVTNEACFTRDSILVTVLGNSVLDLGPDTTFCSGLGDLVLDAGSGFTSYLWNNGAITPEITVNVSGAFEVAVEDANGCIGNDTIVVTINQTPIVDLGSDTVAICSSSPAVTFDAGNVGSEFAWNSGEVSQSIKKGNTDAGDYWVFVTQNNCTASDTVNLTVATALTVDLGPDRDICTGTNLILDAGFGTGFTFDWNNLGAITNQTFTTGQGQVTLKVADSGGCFGKDTINITEVNPLQISLGLDQEICEGDALVNFSMLSGRSDLSIVGWQDATTGLSYSADQSGVYWLEVDSSGCVFRDSVVLTVNVLPAVDLGADTFICIGTTPNIKLTGGTFTSYQWVDITTVISQPLGVGSTQNVSTLGTFGLVVTDLNGCINGDTILVTEEQGTLLDIDLDTVICPSGSAIVSVPINLQSTAGSSWMWVNDGSTGSDYVVTGQSNGTKVEVILDYMNEFGCVTRDTAIVNIDNDLPISLRDTSICEGEDVVFTTSYPLAGYTYTWHDASKGNSFEIISATIVEGGNISVDVVSDEGCSGSANIVLTVNALPTPELSAAPICLGQNRVLDHGLIGVQSVWDHGETTNPITVTNSGLYRVTVSDENNCEDTVSVSLLVNAPPILTLPPDQTLCEGETYALNTGLNELTHTHQWSGLSSVNTSDLLVSTSGAYIVNVTKDATGCSSKDTINFDFLTIPLVELGQDLSICEGDITLLTSPTTNLNYDYLWSTGEVSSEISTSATNVYWLEVTNNKCSHTDSIFVSVFSNPISELMDDAILCFDELDNALSLDPGRNGVRYIWSTGDTSQVITVDQRGTYLVEIENAAGCVTQDFVDIREDCPAHIWLPNAVTMDGNGINDVWTIQGRSIETVEVLIYNRWGELIWEGNAIGQFWDGTHQTTNVEVQQDIYVYHLKYSYLNVNGRLERKQRIGHLSLIR